MRTYSGHPNQIGVLSVTRLDGDKFRTTSTVYLVRPDRLAYLLLADVLGLSDVATELSEQFQRDVVSRLPAEWTISEAEIREFVEANAHPLSRSE